MSKSGLFIANSFQVLLAVILILGVGISLAVDSDRDGMADEYENFFQLDPTDNADAGQDLDSDMLFNWQESELWTDPREEDTDLDGLKDGEDDYPLSRAVMVWGSSEYIFGDMYSYVWPDWMLSAWKVEGDWSSEGWVVPAQDEGQLNILLDYTQVTNNLVLDLLHQNAANSEISIRLADFSGMVTNVTAYASINSGDESLTRYALPFAAYSFADHIVIDVQTAADSYTALAASLYIDEDGDGLDAQQEEQFGTSDSSYDADLDNDGLENLEEFILGTHVNHADSDGDGINDGTEASWGTNANPAVWNDWDSGWTNDFDGDGLTLEEELQYGTNPYDGSDGHITNNFADVLLQVGQYIPDLPMIQRYWVYDLELSGEQNVLLSSSDAEYGSVPLSRVCKLAKGESYDIELSRTLAYDDASCSFVALISGDGVIIDPYKDDPKGIIGVHIGTSEVSAAEVDAMFESVGYYATDPLSYNPLEAKVHILKTHEDFSEVVMDIGNGGTDLSASGRWQVWPPELDGRNVSVLGRATVDEQSVVVFEIYETIENGVLRFDAKPSIGEWKPENNGAPTIEWSVSFYEGNTNTIGLSTPSPFSHRWQENALSQGRKISLSGMPMPDLAQHQESESDYEPESTYVDALSLDVRHDMTDIHVPVGSDHFALEVRRSLTQEIWTTNALQLADRPDKPFGPCWSSAICPNLHITTQVGDVKTLSFSDHNGQSYTFKEAGHYVEGSIQPLYWAEPITSQNALSLHGVEYTYHPQGGWELSLPNGTVCTYTNMPSYETNVMSEIGGGATVHHEYFRIVKVQDRAGNVLHYNYSPMTVPADSIIPSSIHSGSGQEINIKTCNHAGRLVERIEDPKQNTVVYHYMNGRLEAVSRDDGGRTLYTYSELTELDDRHVLYPEYYEISEAVDSHHMAIESITDANGNVYQFAYLRAKRYDYSEITQLATGFAQSNRLYRIGNPLILSSVTRPDGSAIFFQEADGDGIGTKYENGLYWLIGDRCNMVTDVNHQNWTYCFSDCYVTDPTQGNSDIRLFEYQQLTITTPDQQTETYRFEPLGVVMGNGLKPMAIASQENYSGQLTTFAYDYASDGCFKPSAQTNAIGGVKSFTYTTNFGNQIASKTDELGRTTSYGFDRYGNRTNAVMFDTDGVVLSEMQMEYIDTMFANFMTRKTVKQLDSTAYMDDSGWVVDMVTEFVADEYGKVAKTVVDPGGLNLITECDFDANNNLLSTVDPNGNMTTNKYDALNRLVEIQFFEGGATQKCSRMFWYDKRSNKTWERDENGHYTYYKYDEFNHRIETVRIMDEAFSASVSGTTVYTPSVDDIIVSSGYNSDGTLSFTVDALALVTTNQYDALRRLRKTIIDPGDSMHLNYETVYVYGDNCGGLTLPPYTFNPTSVIDPLGYKTTTIYDALNRSVELQANVTNTIDLTVLSKNKYDAVGNPITVSNHVHGAVWQVISTKYDGLNRVVAVTNSDDTVIQTMYTSTGLEWRNIDEMERVSVVEYDAVGRPVLTRSPEIKPGVHAVTETDYDANGNVVWFRDANGNVTENVYDFRNRKTQTIAPAVPDWSHGGATVHPTVTTTYDSVGNLTSFVDPEGNITTNIYDAANRLIIILAPEVPVYGKGTLRPGTTNEYDKGDNIRFTHDANGRAVEMQYDILGRLTNTVDAVGNTISFQYDANGNQRYLTDGKNNTTEFVYDGLNRKLSTIYPGGTVQTDSGYDLVGNRVSRTDCNDVLTEYLYDDRNRLDHVYYQSGKERQYQYDLVGNLTNVVEEANEKANVSYTYDTLNRVKTETSVGVTHTYVYDLSGNRTHAIYGVSGREVDWTYDAHNRVTEIVESGTNVTTYRYDLNGRPVYRKYPSGAEEYRSHDAMGRLLSMATSNLNAGASFRMDYKYDAVGSARKMVQTSDELVTQVVNVTNHWQYDARYRLTNETVNIVGGPTSVSAYAWDAADNRRSKTVISNGVCIAHVTYTNNALNQMVGWHDSIANKHVTYLYDANGNRKKKTETVDGVSGYVTYDYDEDNRLVHAGPQNLIVNGDFEDGNTGFSTDYTLGRSGAGNYTLGVDSKSWNGNFPVRIYDHTSGSGLYLMADGARSSAAIWEQTIDVIAGVEYDFSAWFAKLSRNQNPALEFSIAGEVVGTVVATLNAWNPVGATWTALSTGSITIKISNLTTGYLGNDFGLDDLYFAERQMVGEHSFVYDYRSRRTYSDTPSGRTVHVFDGGLSVQEYSVAPVFHTTPAASIGSYADLLDQGTAVPIRDDIGLRLQGNAWKRVALQSDIAEDTCLTFEVLFKYAGETLAIGLDDDNEPDNPIRLFQLGGSQISSGMYQGFNGVPMGQWVTVQIPVGQYLSGTMSHLVFVYEDGGNSAGLSVFRNIRIGGSPQLANLQTEYLRGPDLGGGVGGMVYSIDHRQSEIGTRIYSHANHRGDVIARSDKDCSLIWFALYEAYGTRPNEWGSNPDRQMANTKAEETEIGLLNEGMRYRDLETGTFLTRDPIGYADGPNIYCYVHCNPITHFDPLGLASKWNPLGWVGVGVRGAGSLMEKSRLPIVKQTGRTVIDAGNCVEGIGELAESAVQMNGAYAKDSAHKVAKEGLDVLGVGEVIMGEKIVPRREVNGLTGYLSVPKKYAEIINGTQEDYDASYSADMYEDERKRGMKRWHAGSNARLASKLSITEVVAQVFGGVVHEFGDPKGMVDEAVAQGFFRNFLIDVPGDLTANAMGIMGGLTLPELKIDGYSQYVGGLIPGTYNSWKDENNVEQPSGIALPQLYVEE